MHKMIFLCVFFLVLLLPAAVALCCTEGANAGCYPAANCCGSLPSPWDGTGLAGCPHSFGAGGYFCPPWVLGDCLECFCTDVDTCFWQEISCGVCEACGYDNINSPSYSSCLRTSDCIAGGSQCIDIGESYSSECCYAADQIDSTKDGCCEAVDGAVCSGVCITTPDGYMCQAGSGWVCDNTGTGDSTQDGCCYSAVGVCDIDNCVFNPVGYACHATDGWVCDNPQDGVNYDSTKPGDCVHYTGTCPSNDCTRHAECTGNLCGVSGWECYGDTNDDPCNVNCLDCNYDLTCDPSVDTDGDTAIDNCDSFPDDPCSINVEGDNCLGTGCGVDCGNPYYYSLCDPDGDADGVQTCDDACLATTPECFAAVGVDEFGCPTNCLDPACEDDPACQCYVCTDCAFPCSCDQCTVFCGGQPCFWQDNGFFLPASCDSCAAAGAPTQCSDHDNECMCYKDTCGVADSPCYWDTSGFDECISCSDPAAPQSCEDYDDTDECSDDPCSFANCLWVSGDCYTDFDLDGIADPFDNCVDVPNPLQENEDSDAWGDVCEYCDYEAALWTPSQIPESTCTDAIDNDCDSTGWKSPGVTNREDCDDTDCSPLVVCGGTWPTACVDPNEWVSTDGTEICDEEKVVTCSGANVCDQRWIDSEMYFCNETHWVSYAWCTSTGRCVNDFYFLAGGSEACDLSGGSQTYCGDGAINQGEQCDGTDWGLVTQCSDLGQFTGGVLICDADCQFDTSACTGGLGSECGDGTIDQGEQCDGLNLGDITQCSQVGDFDGGTLSCDTHCKYDTSMCFSEPVDPQDDADDDGIPDWVDPDDDNDATPDIDDPDQGGGADDPDNDLDNDGNTNDVDPDIDGDGVDNWQDSDDDNDGVPDDGDVDDDNDGVADPEDKDTDNDLDNDGIDNGIDDDDDGDGIADESDDDNDNDGIPDEADNDDDNDGTPDIDDPDNDSYPPDCSDGIIQEGEQCDGTNWGLIHYCSDLGDFSGGALSCGSDCRFDTRLCTGGGGSTCGNGFIDGGEECETLDWGSVTDCTDFDSFIGGDLACEDCQFSTAECTYYSPYNTDSSQALCEQLFSGQQGMCDVNGESGCWDPDSLSAGYAYCCGDDGVDETWMDSLGYACVEGVFYNDPDSAYFLCNNLTGAGICQEGMTKCWCDIGCCGDDIGETWVYATNSSLENLLVEGTCYNGIWYDRDYGNVTYYGLLI